MTLLLKQLGALLLVLSGIVTGGVAVNNLGQTAQRTVIASMPIQNRQGTIQTPTYNVPVDMTGELQIRPQYNMSDFPNGMTPITVKISRLHGTSTWRVIGQAELWVGGDPSNEDNIPVMALNAEDLAGSTVRAEAVVPSRIKVGFNLELQPR